MLIFLMLWVVHSTHVTYFAFEDVAEATLLSMSRVPGPKLVVTDRPHVAKRLASSARVKLVAPDSVKRTKLRIAELVDEPTTIMLEPHTVIVGDLEKLVGPYVVGAGPGAMFFDLDKMRDMDWTPRALSMNGTVLEILKELGPHMYARHLVQDFCDARRHGWFPGPVVYHFNCHSQVPKDCPDLRCRVVVHNFLRNVTTHHRYFSSNSTHHRWHVGSGHFHPAPRHHPPPPPGDDDHPFGRS